MKKIEYSGFVGFSFQLAEFYDRLKNNNNRDWFAENKNLYEKYVKEPSYSLISTMSERCASLEIPFISDPKASFFRIYRDIRFSPNKEPYKTNLGIYFPYSLTSNKEKVPETMGLYFHYEAGSTFIAAGMYAPPSNMLAAFRNKIDHDWQTLEKILNDKTLKKEFPSGLTGDALKRVPRGFPADHPKEDWLRLKQFNLFCYIKFEDCCKPEFAGILERKAVTIAPFLEYFYNAL